MGTTTVRLDPDDEKLLDELAAEYGNRSGALREALRQMAARRRAQKRRDAALDEFLREWEEEAGPVTEEELAAVAERYGL